MPLKFVYATQTVGAFIRLACRALFLLLILAAPPDAFASQDVADEPALAPGRRVERRLAGGQLHAYRLTLPAGRYLHVVAQQRGVDVVVSLSGPGGGWLVEVDSLNGTQGPEHLYFVAAAAGSYRLEVRALNKSAVEGRYEVWVEELRAATKADAGRMKAETLFGEVIRLRGSGSIESLKEILGALAWIMRATGPDDVAMIFLAGHGTPDPYAPQNTYFLPHDAEVVNMRGTAIPFSDIQKIASLQRGRALVFIDAVNSGRVAERLASDSAFDEVARLLDEDSSVIVITSSDTNEMAMESARWGGHGLFTKVLLDVLREKPAVGREEVVTVDELFRRIREVVRAEAAFRQNPRLFKSRPELDFPVIIKR
ncbi:MAG: caspase family protein [Acidobacteriota bacterium]|nr:caspase family protein [Acidobacteriota bacterium]